MHDFGSIQSKQEVFTMLGFTYYTPTKVAFGKGSVERVGELMKQFGGTRVLICAFRRAGPRQEVAG